MSYVLAALSVICAVLCIAFRLKNNPFMGMAFKFLAAFSFLATAITAYFARRGDVDYFLFLLLGLICGMFGDIFLGIKEIAPDYKKQLVLCGIVFFLFGHLFYLVAFLGVGGFSYIPVGVAAGFAILAAVAIFVLKIQAPSPIKIMLVVYYFFITYMSASAGYFAFSTGNAGAVLAFIGAVLFVISDSVLAQIYFTDTRFKKQFGIAETSTYFTAQSLIALSLLFI